MAFSNLKIGRRSFVVVPQRDFAKLQKDSEQYRQLLEEEDVLGRFAQKELNAMRKSGSKGIPWQKVKTELGL